MYIAKHAKRIMAAAMTTALVLTSGSVVATKNASASSAETPTVKVLGATLRLDQKEGYQSMRVGIQVANASAAKSCGINFEIGGKNCTISTDNEKYKKIYAYDKASDTITYTAVITDIPIGAFTQNINVQGTTKAIAKESEVIDSGAPVAKSVNGIVTELQKLDSTIKLDTNGQLVRTVGENEVAITAKDPIFKDGFSSTTKVYNVNKDINLSKAEWGSVGLDESIRIKKTDIVEVVYSLKSGADTSSQIEDASTPISVVLSPQDASGIPYKIQELATYRMVSGKAAGRQSLNRNATYFTTNYTTIKSIAAMVTETVADKIPATATVTLEKVLVTPTDEVAISMHAPSAVEVGATITIDAEIAQEDYDSIEWSSSDDTKATVAADTIDQKKGIVTGVAATDGTVDINATFKKDGQTITAETVSIEVRESYKNKPIQLNLKDAKVPAGHKTIDTTNNLVITDEDQYVYFELPYHLKKGEKLQIDITGSFASNSTGFRLYTSPEGDPSGGGSTDTTTIFGKNYTGDQQTLDNDGNFTISTVRETSKDCANLTFRIPTWGAKITGVTITSVSVTYK